MFGVLFLLLGWCRVGLEPFRLSLFGCVCVEVLALVVLGRGGGGCDGGGGGSGGGGGGGGGETERLERHLLGPESFLKLIAAAHSKEL